MRKILLLILALFLGNLTGKSFAVADARELVDLPQMMQQHMLANMRDHLAAINEILAYLRSGETDKAAETAEFRLGMSSLPVHGASHMAKFMPEKMRLTGTAMHKAASRFALTAQEGDLLAAYNAVSDITAACVACHEQFRIQ